MMPCTVGGGGFCNRWFSMMKGGRGFCKKWMLMAKGGGLGKSGDVIDVLGNCGVKLIEFILSMWMFIHSDTKWIHESIYIRRSVCVCVSVRHTILRIGPEAGTLACASRMPAYMLVFVRYIWCQGAFHILCLILRGGLAKSDFWWWRGEGGSAKMWFFDDKGGRSRPPLKSMTSLINSP